MTPPRLGGEPIGRFLELLASDTPVPGGGAVAAITSALAAGLIAMAARFSGRQIPDADRMAAAAEVLSDRGLDLADDDARVYQDVLTRMHRRMPAKDGANGSGRRSSGRQRSRSRLLRSPLKALLSVHG